MQSTAGSATAMILLADGRLILTVFQGRNRQARTSAIGYSTTESNSTGATSAFNTPPSMPPNDIHR